MTRTFLILVSLCVAVYGFRVERPTPRLDGRIVGGKNANIEEFPYQLSLQSYGSHICGASIISAEWALTAAHCVYGSGPSGYSLRAGSSQREQGGTVHNAAEIHWHPSYNSRTTDYDYALIRVSNKFPLGNAGVKAVGLTTTEPSAGTSAVVTGWGTLSVGGSLPRQLQQVNVPIVKRSVCEEQYINYGITKRMICAGFTQGGKDACQGDSGGPLVIGGRQVGIVSWGVGCAYPNYAGIYSNIAVGRDWIRQVSGI